MTIKSFEPLEDVPIEIGTGFTTEISGRNIDAFFLTLDGYVNNTGAATLATNGAMGLLEELSIYQGTRLVCTLNASELRAFAQLNRVGKEEINPVANAANQPFQVSSLVDFSALVPNGMLLGGGGLNSIKFRGRFAPSYASMSSTAGAPTNGIKGSLRISARTREDVPGVIMSPAFRRETLDLSSPGTAKPLVIDTADELGTLVRALMLRAKDASAAAAGLDAGHANGLIRFMQVEVNNTYRTIDMLRRTSWQHARLNGAHFFAQEPTASGSYPPGLLFLPMNDPAARSVAGASMLSKMSKITMKFDTASVGEAGFTAVAPAAGDFVEVLVLAFQAQSASGGAIDLASPRASAKSIAQARA